MKARLKDITVGSKWIECKPSKHTDKLQKIEVVGIRQHFETSHKAPYRQRNFTYIYYKTLEGSFYPAANSTDNRPLFLDGLIGCIKVIHFNYKPL